MSTCPNMVSPEFMQLQSIYGKEQAVLLYHMNGEEMPTVEQAEEILAPNQVNAEPIRDQSTILLQKTPTIQQPADAEITRKISALINSLGGRIQYVPNIVIDGKVISANAVADVVNKTIQVADGKESVDTLPEEAAHIYVHWLPANSQLLADMMRDIVNRPEYQQVLAEYSNDPAYQTNGVPDIDKLKKEAIGKVIAGVIVGNIRDKKAQSWWKKLWSLIKSLFSGKDFDAFQVSAEDIISGDTSRLDKVREANNQGQYYYQLSKEDAELVNKQMKNATHRQKEVVRQLLLEPTNKVMMDSAHVYTDDEGNVYQSTTERIHGDKDIQGDYELNRLWGNEIDSILQAAILGKPISKVETPNIPQDMKELLYRDFGMFLGVYQQDGTIALTQVTVATPKEYQNNRVAGTIDLLLVHPDGSTTVVDLKSSWDNVKSSQYITRYSVGTGSALVTDDNTPIPVSKKMAHSIQIGSYSKMLNLMGFETHEPITKNIHVRVDNKVNKNLLGYTDEGIVIHPISENRNLVNKVIPIQWQGKEAIPDDNPLHQQHVHTDAEIDNEEARIQQELQERVMALYNRTKTFRDYLDEQRRNTEFKVGNQTIETVDRLIAAVEAEFETSKEGNYSAVYTVFLQSARDQLTKVLRYLSSRTPDGKLVHGDDPEFLGIVSIAMEYLNTYKGLYHTEEFTTPAQKKIYDQVDRLLRDTATSISSAQEYMADKFIYDTSVNQAIKDQIAQYEWDGLQYKSGYTRAIDIGESQKWLGSLGGNTITDVVQKKISDSLESARERKIEQVDKLRTAANKLKAAGIQDFSFMMETDKNGKWNGKVITNINDTYRAMRSKLEQQLSDYVTGEKYQYKEVTSSNDPNAKYNIDLWKKKRAYSQFMQGEILEYDPMTEDIIVRDGKYHTHIPEFTYERNKMMYPTGNMFYTKWEMRSPDSLSEERKKELRDKYPGVSLEVAWNTEVKAFRNKWYNYTPYNKMTMDSDGNPTGVVVRVEGVDAYFPKPETVVPRLIAADNTRLAPEKYLKLTNPLTSNERLQAEFFNTYTEIMQEMVAKLPAEAMYWAQKGNVPSFMANWMNMLSDGSANVSSLVMNYMKNILPAANVEGKDIIAKKAIPVAFMNSVQDITRLQQLEKDLAALISRKDSLSAAYYDKRHRELTEAISIEKKKMKSEELHKDLVLGMEAFIEMTQNFDALASVEDELLNLKRKIEDTEFVQLGTLFNSTERIVQGLDSRTKERFQWFLDNEFYNDATYTKGIGDWLEKRFIGATSVMNIAVNLTGMINNSFIASLNNSIESWGGDFFDRKEYRNTIKEYTTKFLPGYVSTIGTKGDKGSNSYYGDKRAGSKYEAMVEHFNMINHQFRRNKPDTWMAKFFGTLGYGGYEAGEYMVQSQVGISVLKSQMIDGPNGKVSIYDAYNWDPNTGKVTLKEGYELPTKDKHAVTHRIWKTNERIHGNYRWKVMAEKFLLGRLALQFHKWIYPNYLQRFERTKFSEAYGMEIEGRYVTAYKFLMSLKELKSRTDAWNKLTPLQKNNLKKDLADVLYVCVLGASYYILKRLADGVPDDDPYIKKMVHWLSKEADRGTQEMSIFIPGWNFVESYRLIKNPFAVTSSIQRYGTLMGDLIRFPFQDDEERYYDRGVFEGQSKLGTHARDVVPVLKLFNEWNRLDQQSNFYIQ